MARIGHAPALAAAKKDSLLIRFKIPNVKLIKNAG